MIQPEPSINLASARPDPLGLRPSNVPELPIGRPKRARQPPRKSVAPVNVQPKDNDCAATDTSPAPLEVPSVVVLKDPPAVQEPTASQRGCAVPAISGSISPVLSATLSPSASSDLPPRLSFQTTISVSEAVVVDEVKNNHNKMEVETASVESGSLVQAPTG